MPLAPTPAPMHFPAQAAPAPAPSSGHESGLLAKIRAMLVGGAPERAERAAQHPPPVPATPASTEHEDEVADLLRSMQRELDALRKENARLKRGGTAGSSRNPAGPPKSRTSRRRTPSRSRPRSVSPHGLGAQDLRAGVRSALAKAIARDADEPRPRRARAAAQADELSDFSLEDEPAPHAPAVSPDEHQAFFAAVGARSVEMGHGRVGATCRGGGGQGSPGRQDRPRHGRAAGVAVDAGRGAPGGQPDVGLMAPAPMQWRRSRRGPRR